MFGISEKSFQLIVDTIREIKEIEFASVYGSRAMGNFKYGSDVDIVIYGDKISQQTILKLKTQLEQELPIPYFFDITHYESLVNKDLKEHIDRFSKVFFKRED
jgi:uncharacterized protein